MIAWRWLKKQEKKWRRNRELPHDLTNKQKEKQAEKCHKLHRLYQRA